MANWDGKYISPYAEHGKKSEQVKKITVSIPIKVLEILTNERTRRQLKSLRHATNSELLCEAFLHAFTGQQFILLILLKYCIQGHHCPDKRYAIVPIPLPFFASDEFAHSMF